jgi:hypothetical protein
MDARQARALLELIADLYTVANTSETPPPVEVPVPTNGAEVKERAGARK